MTGKDSPSIRLLLADADRTLVTRDKGLTDRSVDAVHKLRDAGMCSPSPAAARPAGCRC
jgi:hypothetical protein